MGAKSLSSLAALAALVAACGGGSGGAAPDEFPTQPRPEMAPAIGLYLGTNSLLVDSTGNFLYFAVEPVADGAQFVMQGVLVPEAMRFIAPSATALHRASGSSPFAVGQASFAGSPSQATTPYERRDMDVEVSAASVPTVGAQATVSTAPPGAKWGFAILPQGTLDNGWSVAPDGRMVAEVAAQCTMDGTFVRSTPGDAVVLLRAGFSGAGCGGAGYPAGTPVLLLGHTTATTGVGPRGTDYRWNWTFMGIAAARLVQVRFSQTRALGT